MPGLRAWSASRNSSSSNSSSIAPRCGSMSSVTTASAASSALRTRGGSPAAASDLGGACSAGGSVTGIRAGLERGAQWFQAAGAAANAAPGPLQPRSAGQEQGDHVVVEAAPERGGDHALAAALQPAAGHGLLQRRGDRL